MTLKMHALCARYCSPGETDIEMDKYFQFFYWEDRPELHAWMERLYHRKGGMLRVFKRAELVLNSHDLDRLERSIRIQDVVRRVSAIFGEAMDSDRDGDLYFIRQARNAIAMGLTVLYVAS